MRHDDLEPLTPREVSVLVCIWNGLTRRETADALGLDESTVANRLHILYNKWHVRNAVQLVRKALEAGVLQVRVSTTINTQEEERC